VEGDDEGVGRGFSPGRKRSGPRNSAIRRPNKFSEEKLESHSFYRHIDISYKVSVGGEEIWFTFELSLIIKRKKMALEVTDTSFAKDVLESGKPAMVDFWATWCGPCRMVGPTVEELAKEFEGQAVVAKVDVDSNQQIAAEYGIRNIPTILFFKDGQVVDKVVGVVPKAQLEQKLKALMN